MIEISIITPVWNQAQLTHNFLSQHWLNYAQRGEIEFIIVNNGSTDNTALVLDQWQRRMANLNVLHNEDNRGFGPGNNQGAAAAHGDILIFLSNDILIRGDYIGLARHALGKSPDMLAGPQLMENDTGWNTFNGLTIPYIYGWCFFCNRRVWNDIGGFDEQFVPCDYEDVDLSLTAAQKGIELRQIPLPLQHISGKSAEQIAGGRLAITLQNQARFKAKWGFDTGEWEKCFGCGAINPDFEIRSDSKRCPNCGRMSY